MKIAICGSMAFSERMLEVKALLESRGHQAVVSGFAQGYAGKSDTEIERLTIKDKNESDAIREYWEQIKTSDAILVLNYERKGIPNYIGGNTLMEIGFAHVLYKRIYLVNPVPDIPFYRSEIEAVQPIIVGEHLRGIE